MDDVEKLLRGLMHGRYSSLTLSLNDFSSNYQTAAEWWADLDGSDHCYGNWVSDDSRERALRDNGVWELHWYPDTPVGFYCLWGASLREVLEAAAAVEPLP